MFAKARKGLSYLAVFGGLLCLGHTAFGQFSGSISGTVTDPSGAMVSGAALSLRNTATNELRTATSTATGIYQFVSLAPGSYELTTTMTGFSPEKTTLTLETNQTLNIPVKLTIGSATQTVEVTGQAPILDSADTRLQ